jgi:hypothetical protein
MLLFLNLSLQNATILFLKNENFSLERLKGHGLFIVLDVFLSFLYITVYRITLFPFLSPYTDNIGFPVA